jgi:hypothetical protein
MEPSTLTEMLKREPFQPFRIKLSNQEAVDILNPDLVVVMKREIFVADPSGDRFRLYYLMHIVGIESLQAA